VFCDFPLFNHTSYSRQTQSKERPYIKEIDCEFVSPEGSFSKHDWDRDPEVMSKKEAPGEEFIDLGAINPYNQPKKGQTGWKQVPRNY
jgi:hypothetical protein